MRNSIKFKRFICINTFSAAKQKKSKYKIQNTYKRVFKNVRRAKGNTLKLQDSIHWQNPKSKPNHFVAHCIDRRRDAQG